LKDSGEIFDLMSLKDNYFYFKMEDSAISAGVSTTLKIKISGEYREFKATVDI
jgi:hypothetical protein